MTCSLRAGGFLSGHSRDFSLWKNVTDAKLCRIAVADVDQHVRFDLAAGEELGIDGRVVEAGHRACVQTDGAQGEYEIGDLKGSVL